MTDTKVSERTAVKAKISYRNKLIDLVLKHILIFEIYLKMV